MEATGEMTYFERMLMRASNSGFRGLATPERLQEQTDLFWLAAHQATSLTFKQTRKGQKQPDLNFSSDMDLKNYLNVSTPFPAFSIELTIGEDGKRNFLTTPDANSEAPISIACMFFVKGSEFNQSCDTIFYLADWEGIEPKYIAMAFDLTPTDEMYNQAVVSLVQTLTNALNTARAQGLEQCVYKKKNPIAWLALLDNTKP